MMRKKRTWAAVCIFLLSLFLCACTGDRDEALILVGQGDSPEISGGVTKSSSPTGGFENSGDPGQDAGHIPGMGEAPAGYTDEKNVAAVETKDKIYVHVCGAVASPGVYALEAGSRGEDALLAAGGFSQDADRDYVNLAKAVADGEKLYFPNQEETRGMPLPENGRAEGTDGESLVNINRADQAALCTLPGIGTARAEDIITYREVHGDFTTCEDIMKVSGIKTSVYDKIKDRITVK